MNNLMIDGKKSVAERIVYNAFDRVEEQGEERPPVEVFHEALEQHQTVPWKFAPAVWVVRLIRCLLRCVLSAAKLSRSAG